MAERAGRAGGRGIGPRPPQGEAPQGHRNPNPCPHYRKCGGCQLQNMTYPQQLIWKQRQVERLRCYISSNYFSCTLDVFESLGGLYASDAFSGTIDGAGGAGTAAFIAAAISAYCRTAARRA